MDEALSRLIPTQRIGNDGFTWWVGQIEGTAQDEKNNKGGYRYKVRIVGDHTSNKEVLPTKNLPWATAIMPITTPFAPGNICGANPQLVKGCWVIGFYLDTEKQKPIIMGSIGQVPGATSVINDIDPNDSEAFKTGVRTGDLAPIPSKDGEEGADGTAKTGGGLATGRKRGDGEEDVPLPPAKVEAIKDEQWCQIVAEKCKDVDLKTQMTNILGELLAEIQNNNGNIGTYYVSKVTGGINSAVSEGRSKVNKAIRVVREFLARVKGWITTKIQEAVDALVKAILQPNESGNVLTPVTEWFNNILKDLGCKMADLGERLEAWLTNLLMSYINQIYRAAICQIDELVNGIISKIQQLMNDLLDSVLGPLQDILGAIAAPLDLIGQAINYVLKLLGISCSGPDQTCAKYKKVCTTGEKKKKDDDEDFLDKLLGDIDNLFGDTPADYTQYICDEAFTGKPLELTTVGFIGGVPAPGTTDTKKAKLTYTINDVTVKEGESAVFTVTRSGFLDISSSLKFNTIKKQGTATAGSDYLEQEGILGFAPGETQKTINIQTLVDQEKDPEETFFIRLKKNSPVDDVKTVFVKNIGKGTITEKDVKKPYDPYQPEPVDPFVPIPDPPTDTLPTNPNVPDDGSGDGGDDDATDTTPSYSVVANRTSCPEGEFIIYTISTSNVESGTILYYNLTGNGIIPSDIIGNKLSGSFIINNNQSKVTVGIEEDGEIEDVETLTFTIAGTGASVDVLITVPDDQDIDDIDQGVGDTPETVFEEFRPPTAKEPITDDNGGIIEIPIDDPGDSWLEPPIVIIGGEGSGATGIALLDNSGSVSEIRIQSPGYGYKLNRASDNDVRCIIDAFTILRPGIGYTSVPDMYVNGELGIAEAVINNDGFVIGARILNREITFDRFPAVDIVGGGGYGAKLLPSLACLDTEALSTIGATKIGTGKYIDCP
mgnify:FL=1|jgi:hypothetical protein|tara:strand:+ start:554 stop:3379 length:2826 start_codon:yes stop_codon:yes gene_type:complete